MDGWFQFGYDGFPGGEARRKFFRQRDDPCDSEEEAEVFNDEDRPVYYFPIKKSEEDAVYDEDDSHELETTCRPLASPLRVSVQKDIPNRAGHTVVPLHSPLEPVDAEAPPLHRLIEWTRRARGGACRQIDPRGQCSGTISHYRKIILIYGGFDGATRAPTRETVVAQWNGEVSQCSRIAEEESVAAALNWSTFGSLIPGAPPARFGHCMGALTVSRDECAVGSGETTVGKNLAHHQATAQLQQQRLVHEPFRRDHFVSLLLALGGSAGEEMPSLMHQTHLHGTVICEPWLCVNVIRVEADNTHGASLAPIATSTLWFPLVAAGLIASTPRLYATLTRWPETLHPEYEAFGQKPRWEQLPAAEPRSSSCLSLSPFAYLGGSVDGREPMATFTLWLLCVDPLDWKMHCTAEETLGDEPAGRFAHSACASGERLFVFGGIGHGGVYLNDLWVLDCRTRVWRELFVSSLLGMPPRAYHTCAIFGGGSSMTIVGGEESGCSVPSVWIFSIATEEWRQLFFPLMETFASLTDVLHPPGDVERQQRASLHGVVKLVCHEEAKRQLRHVGSTEWPCWREQRFPSPAKCPRSGDERAAPLWRDCTWTQSTSLSFLPFAALHGSLPQAVIVDGGDVLVLGGSKSPAMMAASVLPMRSFSLLEQATLLALTSGFKERTEPLPARPTWPPSQGLAACAVGGPNRAPPQAGMTRMKALALSETSRWPSSTPARAPSPHEAADRTAAAEMLREWKQVARKRPR